MPPVTIQAVIFDLDGVLIDSADAHWHSWRRLAADLGIPLALEQFRGTFGRQNGDIIPLFFGAHLDPARIEQLGETKERYYREYLGNRIQPLDGAVDLIRACHAAGWRCALGSSGHPQNIALALRALEVEDVMTVVVTGKDVSRGKPDPQVFLLAAERAGVPPQACAVIEDAPAGIDAALAAAMIAIGVTTSHDAARLAHAHLVVEKLSDLTPVRIAELAARPR